MLSSFRSCANGEQVRHLQAFLRAISACCINVFYKLADYQCEDPEAQGFCKRSRLRRVVRNYRLWATNDPSKCGGGSSQARTREEQTFPPQDKFRTNLFSYLISPSVQERAKAEVLSHPIPSHGPIAIAQTRH
jgi:hypothetical protein